MVSVTLTEMFSEAISICGSIDTGTITADYLDDVRNESITFIVFRNSLMHIKERPDDKK